MKAELYEQARAAREAFVQRTRVRAALARVERLHALGAQRVEIGPDLDMYAEFPSELEPRELELRYMTAATERYWPRR